jgi:hypothetical protein
MNPQTLQPMYALTIRVPSNDDIARAAYLDWLKAGKPSGRDNHFWLEAEARLRRRSAASMGTPIMRRPPLPSRTVILAEELP